MTMTETRLVPDETYLVHCPNHSRKDPKSDSLLRTKDLDEAFKFFRKHDKECGLAVNMRREVREVRIS